MLKGLSKCVSLVVFNFVLKISLISVVYGSSRGLQALCVVLSCSPIMVVVVVVPSATCKVVSSIEVIALSRLLVSCLMLLLGVLVVDE